MHLCVCDSNQRSPPPPPLLPQVHGFLEKNRDTLRDDLKDLMRTSSSPFVSDLLDVSGASNSVRKASGEPRQCLAVRDGGVCFRVCVCVCVCACVCKLVVLCAQQQLHTHTRTHTLSLIHVCVCVCAAAGASGRKRPTVASVFTTSLSNLISTMSKCYPYFVRCIKPNDQKQPDLFQHQLVLNQVCLVL